MSPESVAREQRWHSQTNPCPVCGGGQDRQDEDRCYGYLRSDRLVVFCTNIEGDLPFNDEADAWPHLVAELEEQDEQQDHEANGAVNEARLTLSQFASEKALPVSLLKALGCRQNGNGVEIGGKVRLADPKYQWRFGRSPKTDPLFPPPDDELPETIYVTAGETDAMTLRLLGSVAFGTTSGEKRGKSSLTPVHYRDLQLRGVKHVVIAGDGDPPGQAALKHEIDAAQAGGLTVSAIDLKDDYDSFGAGVKDLNELYQSLDCDLDAFRAAIEQRTHVLENRPYAEPLEDVLAWADEEEGWLIEELLASGTKMLIAAPAKSLKTYFVLHLVACCASGAPLLGVPHYRVPRPLRVLLAEEEGSRPMFGRRIRRVFNGIGKDAQVHPEFRFRRGFNLLDPPQVDRLIEHAREAETDLIVLDPLQRITPGVDENSNSDMRRVWDAVNEILLQLPHVAVIVVAHNRKGDALTPEATRGAGITLGEYDLGVFLEKQHDFTRTDTSYSGSLALTLDGREQPQEFTKEGGAMEVEYVFDYAADTFVMRATGETVRVTVRRTSKVAEFVSTYLQNSGGFVTASGLLTEAQRVGIDVETREAVLKHLRKFEREGCVVAEVRPESRGEKGWKWADS